MRILLRLLANLLRLLSWPIWGPLRALRRRRRRWLHIRLPARMSDLRPPRPWWRVPSLFGAGGEGLTVKELGRALELVAEQPGVAGVIVEIWGLAAGWATCTAVRAELVRAAERGVPLVSYLPQGAGVREFYVASGAPRTFAAPHTTIRTGGFSATRSYVGALLRRLGVSVQVSAAGRFKTAAEPLTNDTMSSPERHQLEELLRSIEAEVAPADRAGPAASRRLDVTAAVQSGLIEGTCFSDELEGVLGAAKGEFPPLPLVPWAKLRARPVWRPLRTAPYVAVVPLHGTIHHGVGPSRGGIQYDPTALLLRELAQSPRVQAVVLHIDSPGGSALTSELLHREVALLARQKPVVAWFSNVAASGGYYIACAADRIVAAPTTVTGSIGVIGIKPVLDGLMGLAGVRMESVQTDPHASMDSLHRAYSEDELVWVREEVEALYSRFIEVVAEGRALLPERVRELAGGRVYSGADAEKERLVDALGGEPAVRAQVDGLLREREPAAGAGGPMRVLGTAARPAVPLPQAAPSAAPGSAMAPMLELWQLAQSGEGGAYYAADLPHLD